MKTIYLEHRGSEGDTQNNKFYTITDDGAKVQFSWGAIGTAGQSKVEIESTDSEAREAVFQKKLKEKVKKGYVVIKRDGVQVEDRPPEEGRGWGLEVETHSALSIEDIVSRMRERGLSVNVRTSDYFHSDGNQWDVKRDGSCGYEFASPISRGKHGLFNAKVAVEKIKEVCPDAVNSSCGVHVTIGVADHFNERGLDHTDLKRLVIGYLKAQENFYAMCNSSRQNNRYCMRNPVENLERIIKATPRDISTIVDMAGGWRSHSDRYHGLNFTRLFSKKVVEFRMLESTVSVRKVGEWIETCVGFVDGLKKSGVTFKSPSRIGAETFKAIVAGTWKPAADTKYDSNSYSSSYGYGGWGHDD